MHIPSSRWGKDHFSTITYAETRAVDHDGYLDMRHMRMDGTTYPTRLCDGEQPGHTDLDCLRDAAAEGLLTVERATRRLPRGRFDLTYQVVFTPAGKRMADRLRQHKADGGTFSNFASGPIQVQA